MADGIPAYVVKNNRTGKKKVVHRARLLLGSLTMVSL